MVVVLVVVLVYGVVFVVDVYQLIRLELVVTTTLLLLLLMVPQREGSPGLIDGQACPQLVNSIPGTGSRPSCPDRASPRLAFSFFAAPPCSQILKPVSWILPGKNGFSGTLRASSNEFWKPKFQFYSGSGDFSSTIFFFCPP